MTMALPQALAALLLINAASTSAQSVDTRLEEGRALLRRIEFGVSPCYTERCQSQKNKHLDDIFRRSTLLPSDGSLLLSHRAEALHHAYEMIANPFQRPSEDFPQSLREWSDWWALRMSAEHQSRGRWLAFSNQVFSIYSAVDLILKRASLPAPKKSLIQEAWDRGAGRIFSLMREHASLMKQSALLRDQGRLPEAESLARRAVVLRQQREGLEDQFGGVFRSVMENLFPELGLERIGNAFFYLEQLMTFENETQLFGEDTLFRFRFWKAEIKKLMRSLQSYNDLEYGVVGLRNFNTSVNPVVSIELELPIQKFLDTFDSTARLGTHLGAGYLMSSALSLASLGYFTQSVLFAGANITANEYDFDLTTLLWDRSDRTAALEAMLPELRREMDQRFFELLRLHRELKDHLQELETQRAQAQGGSKP